MEQEKKQNIKNFNIFPQKKNARKEEKAQERRDKLKPQSKMIGTCANISIINECEQKELMSKDRGCQSRFLEYKTFLNHYATELLKIKGWCI